MAGNTQKTAAKKTAPKKSTAKKSAKVATKPAPKPAAAKAAKPKKATANPSDALSGSKLIDQRIADLNDWRGETLARLRALIKQADPDVIEEVKWRKPSSPLGVPVWSHDGIICTGETYKAVVKMTFAKGASLPDPAGLFNSSLEGNIRRAIDFHEGDTINTTALKTLFREAVAHNTQHTAPKRNK